MRAFVVVGTIVALGLHAGSLAIAEDAGLQVELDPKTGTYSMPAPGRLPETTAPRALSRDSDVIITPGTSPAGGFKVTRPDELLDEKAPADKAVPGAK